MKNLKNILEGLLDKNNRQTVGQNIRDTFAVPSTKDFKRNYFNAIYVEWECEPLIMPYLDKWDNKNAVNIIKNFGCSGLYGYIDSDKIVHLYIYTPREKFQLLGIGGWESTIPAAKKSIISFFKRVQDNPELIGRMFEITNSCSKEYDKNGRCECIYLDEIK